MKCLFLFPLVVVTFFFPFFHVSLFHSGPLSFFILSFFFFYNLYLSLSLSTFPSTTFSRYLSTTRISQGECSFSLCLSFFFLFLSPFISSFLFVASKSLGKVFVTLMDLVLDNTEGVAWRSWKEIFNVGSAARRKKRSAIENRVVAWLLAVRFAVLLPLHRLHYESRGKNQRRSRKENRICLVGLIAARLSRLWAWSLASSRWNFKEGKFRCAEEGNDGGVLRWDYSRNASVPMRTTAAPRVSSDLEDIKSSFNEKARVSRSFHLLRHLEKSFFPLFQIRGIFSTNHRSYELLGIIRIIRITENYEVRTHWNRWSGN